jgi:hypothetical protein
MRLPVALRLAASAVVVFTLSACDGIDFSGIDLSSPPPAPPPPAVVVTSPPIVASTYDTLKNNSNSPAAINSTVDAIIAARNACGGCAVDVDVEGHADARGTTADNRLLSQQRAQDTAKLIQAELNRRNVGGVALNPVGKGESNAKASVTACQNNPNSAQCVADRATVVKIETSYTPPPPPVTAPPVTAPPPPPPTAPPTAPPATAPPATAPPRVSTCLELGTCPADAKPTAAVTLAATASSFASQNSTYSMSFAPVSLKCNNGATAPCGVPTSGPMRTGTAGPYLVSAALSGFALTSPSGYTQPSAYKLLTTPGSDATKAQKATAQFYRATRATQPYTYRASISAVLRYDEWSWDGSRMTVTRSYTEPHTGSVVCSRSTCTFGVLGSNTVG